MLPYVVGIIAPFDCLVIKCNDRVGKDRAEASMLRLARLEIVSRMEREGSAGIGAITMSATTMESLRSLVGVALTIVTRWTPLVILGVVADRKMFI